jgi:hypothetical protein
MSVFKDIDIASLVKYTHGSHDSIDKDVYYVFNSLPAYNDCHRFCSEDPTENRNIIVITDGVVSDCFKGTPDEINNGLYQTYHLHDQIHPLLICGGVKRDPLLKWVRVMRCILSHCSRTLYREEVKKALVSYDWYLRLEVLGNIDLTSIESYGKNRSKEDIYKSFAFQLGQAIGLFSMTELYTKDSISKEFPEFRPFLYREPGDLCALQDMKEVFSSFLYRLKAEQKENLVYFPSEGKLMDVKNERY